MKPTTELAITLYFFKPTETNTSVADTLITWWTDGPYSHVEMTIDDIHIRTLGTEGGTTVSIGGNPVSDDEYTIDTISFKHIIPTEEYENLRKHLISLDGGGYDWTAIIMTNFLDTGVDEHDDYTCSEITAHILKIIGYHPFYNVRPRYQSPNSIYNIMQTTLEDG